MFALLSAGLSGINAYSSASVNKALTGANNRVARAQAEGSNRIRTAGNGFAAAKGSLSRYIQSLQNNQALEAGGAALEENLINARRTEDTLAEASFEDQIRDAEQLGSQAAAAAFAGVGGEVADTVSVSTRLMQQRANYEAARSADFRLYDTARRAAAIQTQTVRSLDNSLIFDSLDYTMDIAKQSQAPSVWGSTAAAIGGSLLSNGGAGASQLWKAASGAFSSSEWGTGAKFGNQDIGAFI